MQIRSYKKVLVRDLRPYGSNSRTHSPEQIAQIEASMREFGFTNPLLIDNENTIIAGHGRLEAAKNLGIDEMPCVVIEDFTPAQRAAYVIADNKLALNAGWDMDMLRTQLDLLDDFGFDLSLTGFGVDEIADIFGGTENQGLVEDDECPPVPEMAICRPGEVWILGSHRLLCGDSTYVDDFDKLMCGQQPNTMVTDPPYGVAYEADWRAKAKGRKKSAKEESSNLQNDDTADWFDAYVLFTGSVAYVWHASSFTDIVMDGLRRAGFDIKQQIIWNKNHLALSRSDYHWKHEPCWYAVKKGTDRNWKGGRSQVTVWDVPIVQGKEDNTSHPTQKPVELFMRAINHHTNPGEYVYDPFAGSGTLMIACEKTGRRALMMELDPKYCDVIINRYEQFTGKKAILETNDVEPST